MTVYDSEVLLSKFESLPKDFKVPTYLELCKYPKRRFEEICSRLLCFYLSPGGDHGMQNLFLISLLEILAPGRNFDIQKEKIKIISEENAEGKRIDILIYSPSFVIGIENKITASLYNPLEKYSNRIQQYGSQNIFRVVLSLKRITNLVDLAYMDANKFVGTTYSDYFERIKLNLKLYQEDCNLNFLTFLNDFIQTLNNMGKTNVINAELSDFFYDNVDSINELIELYTRYNDNIDSVQIDRVTELKEKITQITGTDKWWAWESWDLGINEFDSQKPNIGIESSYELIKGNPLGLFKIYISAWSLSDWNNYESQILGDYPNKDLQKEGNKVYYHVETINDDNEEMILTSLKKYYEYIKSLLL